MKWYDKVWLRMTGRGSALRLKSNINVYDILRARLSGIIKDKYVISPYQAVLYFSGVAPAAKSINLLSDEFASVVPYPYDIDAQKFLERDSDVEALLAHPNPTQARGDFLKELGAWWLMSGNVYVMALGLVDLPPVELRCLKPETITPQVSVRDGYVDEYRYTAVEGTVVFKRHEAGRTFRYLDESGGRELFHFKMFNPNGDMVTGMSKLDQVYYELEQHLSASIHNLSTLKKGARLSGLLMSEQELGDDQRPRLREQLNTEYAGADNAGAIMLLDGAKFSFKEMSANLKDMDFLNLKKEVTNAIYLAFDIPLPLVSGDTMTYSNFAEAKLTLYDNGVLPLTRTLYGNLSHALLPRFREDPERVKLWYDEGEITALAPRRTADIKAKKESGVFTINEIRALYGVDPVPNGDVIYQSPVLVPLGATVEPVAVDTRAPKKPGDAEPQAAEDSAPGDGEDADADETPREKFFRILRAETDHTGERVYTDAEITGLADKRGLL